MIHVPAGGLFYEDVETGTTFETGERTVSADDIIRFAELTGDNHPVHMDDSAAQERGFPGRVAHGLFGLALMEGLKTPLGVFERSGIASLGWDKARFLRPILVGDRLHLRVTFVAKRPWPVRGYRRGVITELVELLNQRGELVSSAEHALLISCRASKE